MKRKTLGSEMRRLRLEKNLTLLEVGKLAGFCEASICHIELDRPVRWETIHLALLLALKINQKDPIYSEMNQLWLAGRKHHAENLPDGYASKTLSQHAVAAVKQFREIVRDLDEDQCRKMIVASRRKRAAMLPKP